MVSPPYSYSPSALSPPYPSHTQLPALNTLNMTNKKRSAADGTPAPALKRRKASTMSATSGAGSAHPLRQTSFPPDEIGTPLTARSPSVDIDNISLVSGSQANSATAAPAKKKRGRKSKAEKAREEQTPSLVGGRAPTAVSGASGPKSGVGGRGDEGDDEGDEGDLPEAGVAGSGRTDAEKAEAKKLRAMLTSYMDWDQFERYSAWRAAKLPDAAIRRLVNSTVSQSVPGSVVTAVRSITKYFLTELIVKAQRVQDEWADADKEEQAEVPWPGIVLSKDGPEARETFEEQVDMVRDQKNEPKETEHIFKEMPNGPLRPDHVREAWRRYKASVEGRGAGGLGLWHTQQHSGVERFPARTGGKRILK